LIFFPKNNSAKEEGFEMQSQRKPELLTSDERAFDEWQIMNDKK
jgi:hypothetical protein